MKHRDKRQRSWTWGDVGAIALGLAVIGWFVYTIAPLVWRYL